MHTSAGTLFTIGHSNRDPGDCVSALVDHRIKTLCDVRNRPGSSRFPQFNREPLEIAAGCAKIQYQFLGDSLGGRPDDPRVYRSNGVVDYAARRISPDFLAGIDRLLQLARPANIALMCAEEDPLHCHRLLMICPALDAKRSICGCETQNPRLELCANELRATLALPSGEVLRDLAVVDRDWRDFIDAALALGRGANRTARLERYLNSHFLYKIMSCPHHFIRLGLSRPFHDLCWLMVDTLFPLPKPEWLQEF